jgi:hypothetical protein
MKRWLSSLDSPRSVQVSSASQVSCASSWRLSDLDALIDQAHDALGLAIRITDTETGRPTEKLALELESAVANASRAARALRESVAGVRPSGADLPRPSSG